MEISQEELKFLLQTMQHLQVDVNFCLTYFSYPLRMSWLHGKQRWNISQQLLHLRLFSIPKGSQRWRYYPDP
jgi:hypothetical protein